MPSIKFHGAKFPFVLSADRTPQKNHKTLVCLAVSHLSNVNSFLLIEVPHTAISWMATWCSLFYGAVSRLELMLALGNNGHSSAWAKERFRPAIWSDCDTAWLVTWHFRLDYVRWLTVIFVSVRLVQRLGGVAFVCLYTTALLVASSTLSFWIPGQTPFASTSSYSSVVQSTRLLV